MSKSILIYGFHSIEAQLNSNPECILNVFVQTGRSDSRMSEMIFISPVFRQINFSKIDKNKLDRLTKGEPHQGIVAKIVLPPLLGHEALIELCCLNFQVVLLY